jgi:hypothetical protein
MGRAWICCVAAVAAGGLAGCSSAQGGTLYTGFGASLPNGAYLNEAEVALVPPSPLRGRHVVGKRVAELAALEDATWARGVLGAVLATATSGVAHTDANGPDPLVWVVSMEAAPRTYLFEYIDAYSGRSLGASGGPLPGFSPAGSTLPVPAARTPSPSTGPLHPPSTPVETP